MKKQKHSKLHTKNQDTVCEVRENKFAKQDVSETDNNLGAEGNADDNPIKIREEPVTDSTSFAKGSQREETFQGKG